MPISFKCPHCGIKVTVNSDQVGRPFGCENCGGETEVPVTTVAPGMMIGPLWIQKKLGTGDVGEVFLAKEMGATERLVAVKILSPALTENPEVVEAFLEEARCSVTLDHPNLVRLLSAAETDGHYCLVSEYVEGETLAQRLARTGPVGEADARRIAQGVATGLQAAWDTQQLVHANLKLTNVMVDDQGTVRVLDVGRYNFMLTKLGRKVSGQPSAMLDYASPEMALGDGEWDGRADIHALGAMLCHLLTGQPPAVDAFSPIPDVHAVRPEISGEFASLVARMMSKALEQRPQAWAEVLAALGALAPLQELARLPLADHAASPSASGRRNGPKPSSGTSGKVTTSLAVGSASAKVKGRSSTITVAGKLGARPVTCQAPAKAAAASRPSKKKVVLALVLVLWVAGVAGVGIAVHRHGQKAGPSAPASPAVAAASARPAPKPGTFPKVPSGVKLAPASAALRQRRQDVLAELVKTPDAEALLKATKALKGVLHDAKGTDLVPKITADLERLSNQRTKLIANWGHQELVTIEGGYGLRGEYYANAKLEGEPIVRVDAAVEFQWGSAAPDPRLSQQSFSVRWTGFVEPEFSETYTFYTYADDGTRLWVGEQQLIDDWTSHGWEAQERKGTIELQAGERYALRLEYFQGGGGANIYLQWSSPSCPRQGIPMVKLFPPAAEAAPAP